MKYGVNLNKDYNKPVFSMFSSQFGERESKPSFSEVDILLFLF